MKVHAFGATEAGGKLIPFEYEFGPLSPTDVDIDVKYCGICHSDLSMLQNDWGITEYPFVPGHEVVGVVSAIGNDVYHLNKGDWVGLGWHSKYCNTCECCLSGDHNLCSKATGTIVGRYGGFADKVRADVMSVFKLPDGLEYKSAGPLFCGGITVFNPLIQNNVKPIHKVGVIGIGGLGHLALQFYRAWGCEVTAFSSHESKKQEALDLGAHYVINSRDSSLIAALSGKFDFLISTVNAKLDWNLYLSTLKPKGRLHFVGATMEPLDLQVMPMISGQRSVSASPVGSPATILSMLDFSKRHSIKPQIEVFPFEKVNEAMLHLKEGKARYRIVLANKM